jgi:hypothetical protein
MGEASDIFAGKFIGNNGACKISLDDFLKDIPLSFKDTLIGQATGYKSSEELASSFVGETGKIADTMYDNWDTTVDKVNGALGLIGDGVDLSTLDQKFTDFLGKPGEDGEEGSGLLGQISTAVDTINTSCGDMATAIQTVGDELEKWNKIDLSAFMATVKNGTEAFIAFQKSQAPEAKDPAKEDSSKGSGSSGETKPSTEPAKPTKTNTVTSTAKKVSTQGDGNI